MKTALQQYREAEQKRKWEIAKSKVVKIAQDTSKEWQETTDKYIFAENQVMMVIPDNLANGFGRDKWEILIRLYERTAKIG